MNTPLLTYIFFILLVYFLYEIVRTMNLIHKIEKPLAKHYKEWKDRPRSKRFMKNNELQKDFFAYSCFSPEQLVYSKIFLKSFDNESTYLNTLMDLFIKILFPIFTFQLGAMLTTSNNLFSAINKSIEPDSKELQNKIMLLFKMIFESSGNLLYIAATVISLALINASLKTVRRNKINLHLTIIEEIMKNRT